MLISSKKEIAFESCLSIQARLSIQLENALTDEEKFIECIRYATLIAEKKVLGLADEIADINLHIIIKFIKSYLDAGISPNVVNKNNVPVLFYAITFPDLVKLLLIRGANPNLQTSSQETPLHHASRFFHSFFVKNLFDTVELLASAGANLTAVNHKNKTPIGLIKETLYLSENRISEIEAKFKQITEHPRGLIEIISEPAILESPYSSLQLTENDHIKIQLFKEKKYLELIASHPQHKYASLLNRFSLFREDIIFKSNNLPTYCIRDPKTFIEEAPKKYY